MSATSITLRGRVAAQALMVDACTITRTATSSTNLQTGAVTKTTSTIYAGQCRVQRLPSGGIARPAVVGEAQLYQQPLYVQVPATVGGVLIDDTVTITASALDQDLVGRTFWVKELPAKTHTTMHRYGVEEVTG